MRKTAMGREFTMRKRKDGVRVHDEQRALGYEFTIRESEGELTMGKRAMG